MQLSDNAFSWRWTPSAGVEPCLPRMPPLDAPEGSGWSLV